MVVAPLLIGVVFVVGLTLLILFGKTFFNADILNLAIAFENTLCTMFHVRMDKDVQTFDVLFAQDIIRTASDNDAWSFGCTVKDDALLRDEDLVLWTLEIHGTGC